MEEFLRGLKMSVVFGPFTAVDHARVVQLINKTNQFNTTTRRYASEEVEHVASQPEALTLQFRLLDRVGDNGLVSTMILRPTPDDEDVLEIENWVMSCRVFGRQLEFEAMNIAVEAARAAWRAGAYRELYSHRQEQRDQYAVSEASALPKSIRPASASGATRWFLNLADYVVRDTHISCESSRMTEQEILSKFTRILRDLLLDDSIELTMETRREDIPNWDSFNYINFIVAVEIEFGVKFKVADIESFANVGAIVKETTKMLA